MRKKFYLFLMMLVECISTAFALCPECNEWHENADFICPDCGRIDDCHDQYYCLGCGGCAADDGVDCDICGEGMFCSNCITECANGDAYMCGDCRTTCIACEEYFCEGCLVMCDECGDLFCGYSGCYSACETCGAMRCINCLLECSEGCLACEGCLLECSMCGNGFCGNHMFECESCGEYICDECSWLCGCGALVCGDCRVDCAMCKEPGCKDCYGECENCGDYYCDECLFRCDLCGSWIDEYCLIECACGNLACIIDDCYAYCNSCGTACCLDCIENCSGCDGYFCDDCFGECEYCNNGFCTDKCLTESNNCGFLCKDHYYICSICDEDYCLDCVFECVVCERVICLNCNYECEICSEPMCEFCYDDCECGTRACLACLADCSGCGENLCELCRATCYGCGESFCIENCLIECSDCGEYICDDSDCRVSCHVCGDVFCYSCVESCTQCSEYCCNSCLCPTCGICYDCHEDFFCGMCDGCLSDGQYECAGCGVTMCEDCAHECDECGDALCKNCMCSECETIGVACGCHDAYDCSECGGCGYGNMCDDGGDHCQNCCKLCSNCDGCVLVDDKELCEYCGMCEDCYVDYHCSDCLECHENVDVCDQHSDPICNECAAKEGLHCPDCLECYEVVGVCLQGKEHCQDCCSCGDSGIDINEVNFPDASWRNVIATYDVNDDRKLSATEIKKITTIKSTSTTIESLQGFKYLTSLKSLDVQSSTIKTLEGAWLPTSLEELSLHLDKSIEKIDFPYMKGLRVLNVADGGLTELSVAKLPSLTTLNCSGNAITSLNMENVAESLTYLDCSNNQLLMLDLSFLKHNLSLNLSGNGRSMDAIPCGFSMESLDPSMKTYCIKRVKGATLDYDNQMWTVNEDAEKITYTYSTGVGRYSGINWLSADSVYTVAFNSISHGWSGCSSSCVCGKESCSHETFTNGVCDNCGMVKVDAETFPDATFRSYVSENVDSDGNGMLCADELEAVTCIESKKSLGIHNLKGIEHFTKLTTLVLFDTITKSVDLSSNIQLAKLLYFAGYSDALDLSANEKLETVSVIGVGLPMTVGKRVTMVKKGLTSVNLSKCVSLTSVNLQSNLLSSLDVSASKKLTSLTCSNNKIEKLNMEGCSALSTLKADGNCLMGIDLKPYSDLTTVDLSGNVRTFDSIPNLFFLNQLNSDVEDIYVTPESGFEKDANTKRWMINDSTATSITYMYDSGNILTDETIFTVKFDSVYAVPWVPVDVDDVVSEKNDVLVYTEVLSVYVENAMSDVVVYNLLGQMVGQVSVGNLQSKNVVDVPVPGVYIVKSGRFSRRVLVKE